MRYIKRKKRKKDTIYKYDDRILQVKLMNHAKIEEMIEGYFSLVVVMQNGNERRVMDSVKREYLVKECDEINMMIRREND